MTGKIINIEDGKVTIRVDNGQTIMIPISDVSYNGPQIGDYVSLRRNGNQWEVFKSDSNHASINADQKNSRSGRKIIPAIIGILVVIIAVLVVTNAGKVSKKETAPASSSQSTAESKTVSIAKKTESTATSETASVATISTPSSSDTTVSSTSSVEQTADAQQQELQMVSSGYYIDGPDPTGVYYVHFAAEIKNPNSNIAASFPDLKATAKDANGTIVGSQDQVGMYVMPGDTVVLSSLMDAGTAAPKTVDFSLSVQQYVSSEGLNIPSSSDFKIENVAEVASTFGKKVTGQVTYTGTEPCSSICLTALYKKAGQIVYSDLTFVDNPTANSPTSFEITPTAVNVPNHDTVEVFAQYWS